MNHNSIALTMKMLTRARTTPAFACAAPDSAPTYERRSVDDIALFYINTKDSASVKVLCQHKLKYRPLAAK